MTTAPATLVRWLVDPARQEELLGDLEELAGRGTGRFWLDVASVCVRQSRLVAAARSPSRLAAALAVLAALAMGSTAPTLRTVRAVDPAGEFTLQFEGTRVVRATLDGAPVPPHRLVQEPGRLVIRGGGDAGNDLSIRLASNGSFSWRARSPRPTAQP
ncbi:MAG TPA: hypothetical protein VLB49_09740 [Gemmatimonadales bacterium]|nr:hypothetical protein [Gemmatimonadales bacterium]